MPIPLPNLDDRRWTDLVEEGRSLIPLYAPEWTDHNASDPGITLLELFAWVSEANIFRLNRIPDRHRRRFLALLGLRAAPPRPARGVLGLQLKPGYGPFSLPSSTEFAGSNLAGTTTLFRTLSPVPILNAHLDAIQVHGAKDSGSTDLTAVFRRDNSIPAFGADPAPGAELYLGFQGELPAGQTAALYLRFASEKANLEERRNLSQEARSADVPPHHSVRTVWEYLATEAGQTRWLPLETEDDTRSMSLNGIVRWTPRRPMPATVVGSVARPLRYIRCRFVSGGYDSPPILSGIQMNSVEVEQAAPAWQTFPIAKGVTASGPVPKPGDQVTLRFRIQPGGAISELHFDSGSSDGPKFTVLAYHPASAWIAGSLTIEAVLAGSATGEPFLKIPLRDAPIDESSFQLFSLEDSSWRNWEQRDDLAASTRRDAHFQLDSSQGELHFGDGERGYVPPGGSMLLATYRATLADAGNVDAGQITRLYDSLHNRALIGDVAAVADSLTVTNPFPADGGAAQETLAHTIGRGIELREAHLRAVTVDDFETIARETAGTQIARVKAKANLYPSLDCVSAPGVVTVIVVPDMPGPRPQPSPGLLRRVGQRLERRRIVGTRVMIVGPDYLEVVVRARVKAFPGTNRNRLRDEIERSLAAFFHPLLGGPDGTGWPFGRDVYRSEVMQVLDETPGVDHVVSLELIADSCPPQCGNICLAPAWLVASGTHEIEVV
jgi:Baseplate J-like protein